MHIKRLYSSKKGETENFDTESKLFGVGKLQVCRKLSKYKKAAQKRKKARNFDKQAIRIFREENLKRHVEKQLGKPNPSCEQDSCPYEHKAGPNPSK